MSVVKCLAAIFLAAYLILGGLVDFTSMSVPAIVHAIINLIGITAGILILISLGCHHRCDSSNCCRKD